MDAAPVIRPRYLEIDTDQGKTCSLQEGTEVLLFCACFTFFLSFYRYALPACMHACIRHTTRDESQSCLTSKADSALTVLEITRRQALGAVLVSTVISEVLCPKITNKLSSRNQRFSWLLN